MSPACLAFVAGPEGITKGALEESLTVLVGFADF
jgi:hypothetical protein